MTIMRRKVYTSEGHAHFVTFSCYKRRRLLDDDRAKRIVVHFLAAQLRNQNGCCHGFVVMPEHVHALVWFPEAGRISVFMNQWKRRSSMKLKELLRDRLTSYARKIDLKDPQWQPKYYGFNIYSQKKLEEKLHYMHNNPVKAGLVETPEEWRFGSARWYLLGKSVGVAIGAKT